MGAVVLALIAVASLAATWLFCLRPMWKGRCGMSGGADQEGAALQWQIAELTEEVRMLRAQDALAEDRRTGRRDG